MNTRSFSPRPAALLFAVIVPLACAVRSAEAPIAPPLALAAESAYDAAARVTLPEVPPTEEHGLHNVYRLSPDIVSGSEPTGEEAFRVLRDMGVRTILSVDGKVPDAEMAQRYGLEYVHVPIQYRGITADEMTRIVKTFREKPGPFYVHCFHGEHRGPTAAAVGRVALDGVTREQAIAEMRQWCGTAPTYEGLYRAVATGRIPTVAETDAYPWDFPAAQPLAGFRHAMIEITRIDDDLKMLSKRGWQPDPGHPDVDALNEASKLAGFFERASALDEVAAKPADFRDLLDDAIRASAELRTSLHEWQAGQGSAEAATQAYAQLTKRCTACHDVYRND